MLAKDRLQRLGQNDDMDEIMLHPFFRDVDIEALLNKSVKPPFVPEINNKNDLRNFDPEVTQQNLAESILPPEAKQIISSKADAFNDFGPVMQSDDSLVKSKASKNGHSSGESSENKSAAAAANGQKSKDTEEKKE